MNNTAWKDLTLKDGMERPDPEVLKCFVVVINQLKRKILN